jgi:hypothetical protein
MANMSYCRFENTCRDLRDCRDALVEGEELSESELTWARLLVALCEQIIDGIECGDYPALNGKEDRG